MYKTQHILQFQDNSRTSKCHRSYKFIAIQPVHDDFNCRQTTTMILHMMRNLKL